MAGSLRDHLTTIYKQYDALTPKIVVQVARNPDHPLHSQFEWNDTEAAEKYREVQAARLIRKIKVSVQESPGSDAAPVRAFVSVPRPTGATYVPIGEVVQDEFQTGLMLRQAEREWKQLLRRYEGLVGFVELVRGDIDKAS